ncbi:MAG: hypothetical protein AAGJ28_18435, partial [Pseudomonadota bacterium]
ETRVVQDDLLMAPAPERLAHIVEPDHSDTVSLPRTEFLSVGFSDALYVVDNRFLVNKAVFIEKMRHKFALISVTSPHALHLMHQEQPRDAHD